MKVGFIGLGTMGQGMAANLTKAGIDLVVHDVDRTRAASLIAAGAGWAGSAAEVGQSSEVVFTSLPGPKEMEAVAVAPGGLLHSLRSGGAWFDLTTNSPTLVKRLAPEFEARGLTLLDAPVSGGAAGARSGRLAIYVGGDLDVFERHKPLLDAIGDRVLHVGPVGAGNTAKLAHNCCSMTVRMVIAEVFTLGVKAGMDPLELWNAVRQGVLGRSRTFDGIGAEYLQSKYDPANFTLRLAHKDFTLALDLAREMGVPMRQAETAYEAYSQALERGWGERDSRVAMHVQNERAGIDIKVSAADVERTLAKG